MCNNCNPCDDCAPKCHECCNPNIQGDWCVTVDQSEEWIITISAPCPIEVTSDDWTIWVTKKEPHDWYSERFDLTVNKEDRLVAACWNDGAPGTLDVKLEEWHWIDISTVNCWWWWDARLRIEVDESELNIQNNKVAVDWWCPADYLWNLFRNTSNLIEIVPSPSSCQMIVRDKDNWIICWKVTMQNSIKWHVDWWWTGWNTYYMTQNMWCIFDVDFLYNMEVANGNCWLIIKYDWIYEVWFRCSLEASFWVHAVRWWLFVMRWANYYPIAESRFSWPVWKPPYEFWHWEQNFNALYMNECTETTWVDWQSASLWAVLDRMPCEWTTRVKLYVWDVLFLWMKWQWRTQYNNNWTTISWDALWWEIAMLWVVGNQAWEDVWAQIWADLKHPL